jgi:predicted nucleic acid-binding protein
MLKLIVDANILISAYAFDGEVRRYWLTALGPHRLIVSPEIIIEVEKRLRSGEFHLSDDQIRSILVDILDRCELVRPVPPRDVSFADSTDAHLAALVNHDYPDGVGPHVLLTGDARLLRLSCVGSCKVMEIGAFCHAAVRELK